MSAFPRPAYLERVSNFIVNTTLEDLTPGARDRGRWVIADSIPVIAAGMQTPELKALAKLQLANAASGESWVLGTGRRASALDAGLLNGTAGTCLELDEGNLMIGGGHTGIQVVPAALAVAQEVGASGADLLLAATMGYEISSRIIRAAKLRPPIHPHGTYGLIGAAIAVGMLRRFSQTQMRELLNVAATMSMATSRRALLEGATVRNIYTGHSALMGQIAARLVQSGFTGEVDTVQSIYGGGVLSDTFDPGRVIDGLGSEWVIEHNYFKLHCTGRYVHSAIDALEAALATQPGGRIDPALVEHIDVKAYKLAAALAGKHITTSFGARFSVPFALASILYHGKSGLKSFDEAAVANPVVQHLVSRVDVAEEPSFNDNYPNEQRCDVTIRLKNDSEVKGQCRFTKGETTNPHTAGELEGKFFELGNSVWSADVTRTLFDACMRLEHIPDLRVWGRELAL